MRRRRRQERPVVLFFDQDCWNCFLQLAAALRRAGARPVCVQRDGDWRQRVLGRVGYGTVLSAGRERDLRRLERMIDAGRVADVQLNELNLALLDGRARCAGLLRRATGLDAGAGWPLNDKLEVSRQLAAGGIEVPPFADVDAADALGYPLMVKRRLSSGGIGVLAVAEAGALTAATERLSHGAGVGSPSPPVFLERQIAGEVVQYAALVGPDGIEAEVCLLVRKDGSDPLGPSVGVVVIGDPALVEAGRRLVEVLGCSGLVNAEFMRDSENRLWHIDLSARAYGNIAALSGAGADMIGAYLRLFGLDGGKYSQPALGTELAVFPTAFLMRKRAVGLRRAARRLPGEAWPYLRTFGIRYLVATALTAIDARSRNRAVTHREARPRAAFRSPSGGRTGP